MKEDETRTAMMEHIMDLLKKEGEDPHQTKGNRFMFPATEKDGTEFYFEVTVAIPKGSRDGEPYNGYQEAEDYQLEVADKEAKAKKRQAEKEAAFKALEAKRAERKKIAEMKRAAKMAKLGKTEEKGSEEEMGE